MMGDMRLGAVESRFAEIIWENEPLTTNQLKTENSIVTSVISRQEFEGMQSEQFVEENFKGSLPAFLAAFSTRKKLTDKESDEMKNLIERMRG